MSPIPRLLLIAPPLMHKTPAMERAAALAHAHGARLHVVAFDYVEGLATAGLVNAEALAMLREDYVQRHRHWLEEQAQPLRHSGLTVTTEVVWVEHTFKEMLTHISESQPDLVIKDVEHDSLLMRTLFTPLDMRLLHASHVPLHFVAKDRHPMPRRIAVAVDLMAPEDQYPGFNDQLIYTALKLGLQCKAEVELVYAYDLSAVDALEAQYAWTSLEAGGTLPSTLLESQTAALSTLAERNGIEPAHHHLLYGSPTKALAQFVETHDIDILVVGRRHRRRRMHLLGSTTERLLYRVATGLWIIDPSCD